MYMRTNTHSLTHINGSGKHRSTSWRTYICTQTHTHTLAHTHKRLWQTQVDLMEDIYMYTNTHTHTHSLTHINGSGKHRSISWRTYICTQTHTHTHTLAHTHKRLWQTQVDLMEDILLQYISSVVSKAAATASDTLKPRLDERDILFVVGVCG